MTLRRLENWGAAACSSLAEQKLNSLLCSWGLDELSSRGTKSHWGRSGLIYTHCHRHERGYEGDREGRQMRLIILPTERKKDPLAFYRGACQDMIPWWAKKRCYEEEAKKKPWKIQQSPEYRFLKAPQCIFEDSYPTVKSSMHVPQWWRDDSEHAPVILFIRLSSLLIYSHSYNLSCLRLHG